MKNLNPFQCDICNTPKQATNHWWLGYLVKNDQNSPVAAAIELWNDFLADQAPVAHLCGIECAQKWLTQQLDKLHKS